MTGRKKSVSRQKSGGRKKSTIDKKTAQYVAEKQNPSYLDTRKLQVGDVVEARFTHGAGWQRFPARITKINKNSVRAIRIDGKPVWAGDDPHREFIVPKIESENNGIFKLSQKKKNELLKKMSDDLTYEKAYSITCPKCGGKGEGFEIIKYRTEDQYKKEARIYHERHTECGYENYDIEYYEDYDY